MTRDYANRLYAGLFSEFLVEVFGLSEGEYPAIFGKCERTEKKNNPTKNLTVETEVSGK